jgi:hypothetical protein
MELRIRMAGAGFSEVPAKRKEASPVPLRHTGITLRRHRAIAIKCNEIRGFVGEKRAKRVCGKTCGIRKMTNFGLWKRRNASSDSRGTPETGESKGERSLLTKYEGRRVETNGACSRTAARARNYCRTCAVTNVFYELRSELGSRVATCDIRVAPSARMAKRFATSLLRRR